MNKDVEFAAGVGLGLVQAVRSDPDVLLTAAYGVAVGARRGPLAGLSAGLGLYIVYRMVAQSFGMNLARLAAVMEREEYRKMNITTTSDVTAGTTTAGSSGYAI